jgi:hypothetical protein
VLPNPRGFVNFFSKISSSQHYPYSLPFFQKYYKHPIYFPSFHHLLRLIIFFLSRTIIGIIILKTQIKNCVKKKNPPMIQIHPFKKKEREGNEKRSQFSGQWKVPLLGGQWEVLMFGGQWKVPMLGG